MVDKSRTFDIFLELSNVLSLNEIAKKLSLHIGTLKRWMEKREVPVNYYNDINALLNNKYPPIDNFRAKDQFFTLPMIAKYCYKKTVSIIKKMGMDIDEYCFIEPSAGCCSFYELLPSNKRIGIDIDPKGKMVNELIKSDYLIFVPDLSKKYIVIGNPPFGLRGNLALRFINHSSLFADFVAFILPPLFDSTGKGVPMKRVEGYKLILSEKLPVDSFCYPNGEKVSIATIFQIWSKYGDINLAKNNIPDYSLFFKIYSVSNGDSSSSKRNVKMINNCDAYLPSTCFSGMRAYSSFFDLPNKRGYGIKIYKNKNRIMKIIYSIKWEEIAFLSTNSALNLRTDLIINALIKQGAVNTNEKTINRN